MTRYARFFFFAMLLLVVLGTSISCRTDRTVHATVADLQTVHAGVSLDDGLVLGVVRIDEGASVESKPEGRARLRLDDGTQIVMDGDTKLIVKAGHVAVERGRIFVLGAEGAKTQLVVAGAVVTITGGHAAATLPQDNPKSAKVYAASGELSIRAGDKDHTVQTGETAAIDGPNVKVAPERAFDDWTGGLASPWSASGQPCRAVGELWGRTESADAGDPGSPLTIRAQDVAVKVEGETAKTVVRSTFFHAGSEPVRGDFRMAVPSGAIVSGFSAGIGDALREGRIALAARDDTGASGETTLEWAGDGWVRGSLPTITPGAVVTVVVQYVEWLTRRPAKDGKGAIVTYRFPLVAESDPPIIGEFSAKVDFSATPPRAIHAGFGSEVADDAVLVRKSDFRPSADFVVELELAPHRAPARMYVAPAEPNDEAGSYVLVRAEAPDVPADQGVSLAIVLDASASMDAGMLESGRAFVEALVGALGPQDQVVVFASDEAVRAIGPKTIGPIDDARRKAIMEGLAALDPGGATDLGVALESAADALDPKRPNGMVVYVGDGWPTVGDLAPDAMRARLARRASGQPRLAAVAVGSSSSRFNLTALVRGSGPILQVSDRGEAAEAASALLFDALQPSVARVELDLGPDMEQVYPLYPQAIVSGQTVFAVGRTRVDPPRQVTLKWSDAAGPHEKKLATTRERIVDQDDIKRRWASSRVEELALRRRGREAVTDVALHTGLLTPWTGWTLSSGSRPTFAPSPLSSHVMDLAPGSDAIFSADLATPSAHGSTLLDLSMAPERSALGGEEGYRESVRNASRRALDAALGGIRACRDSRAALRPDLTGTLEVRMKVDGDGRPSDVKVVGSKTAYDLALFRCVEAVVEGLSFPASGLTAKIEITHVINLPPGRSASRTKCSATSRLPLAARRGVWSRRLDAGNPQNTYVEAKRACEAPDWAARRTLLELIVLRVPGAARVSLARELETLGEKDAADFLRREALRRARFPEELRAVRNALLQDEGYPSDVFEKQYKAAANDQARLAVVRRFLGLAPHDVRLQEQLLVLLEAIDDKAALGQEIARIRRDPFADASLMAKSASALKRIGQEAEARRAFGEIVERAPGDPWARAFAGDRLRAEGWFDEATALYVPLEQQMTAEQAVLLRLALAHAGAGRIDLAGRVFARLTQTQGRSADTNLSDVASDLAAIIFLQPREGLAKSQQDELTRRALELSGRPGGTIFLVRWPVAVRPIEAMIVRGPKDAREDRAPEVSAEPLGIHRLVVDAEDASDIVLRLIAKEQLAPSAPIQVRVDVLVSQGRTIAPILVTRTVDLPQDGKKVELPWAKDRWGK